MLNRCVIEIKRLRSSLHSVNTDSVTFMLLNEASWKQTPIPQFSQNIPFSVLHGIAWTNQGLPPTSPSPTLTISPTAVLTAQVRCPDPLVYYPLNMLFCLPGMHHFFCPPLPGQVWLRCLISLRGFHGQERGFHWAPTVASPLLPQHWPPLDCNWLLVCLSQ